MHFRLCRFQRTGEPPRPGLLVTESVLADLGAVGAESLASLLEAEDPLGQLTMVSRRELPKIDIGSVTLLPPVDHQEVWAAGVTYLRSKKARMEESDFSANAYDRVYEAARPELFFKSLPNKVVPPGEPVGIRRDARWNVPEPELALVLNSRGRVVGFTIGNDMSSRDIEGENLLYLPQAKTYHRSCAVGPFVVVGPSETEVRQWSIELEIRRKGETAFAGKTSVGQIKRSFEELAQYLFRSQIFPTGAILLTGTGIIPPDTFSLEEGDDVTIRVSGIGTLRNPVIRV